MSTRPLELRPYRIGVYVAFGLLCAALFTILIRSVYVDLYPGRTEAVGPRQTSTPRACLDDLDRLYGQLAARAVQPSPRGLDQGLLASEWDRWTRRWEGEVAGLSARCGLGKSNDAQAAELASALSSLEDLRRELARCGENSAEEASRVRDALAAARERLRGH